VDEEELIKFWRSSASGYGSRNFKNSLTLRNEAFFRNLVHRKTDPISIKIVFQM